MGANWRALAAAEPSAVLHGASRWIAFGFGQSAFRDLLLEVLIERARDEPALIDTLANALTPDMPVDVINIARELLNELRNTPPRTSSRATIYVSSTLPTYAYRKALSLAIRRLGHVDMAMDITRRRRAPVDRCVRDAGA
jgi:hypothetical protein